MDAELRAFLEDRFGRLGQTVAGLEQRVGKLEEGLVGVESQVASLGDRLAGVESQVGGLKERMSQLGALLESVQDQVRLVAEGHSVLYGAIDRQYEEVRAELRDVRSLLRLWNELVTKRLRDLEYRVRERAG